MTSPQHDQAIDSAAPSDVHENSSSNGLQRDFDEQFATDQDLASANENGVFLDVISPENALPNSTLDSVKENRGQDISCQTIHANGIHALTTAPYYASRPTPPSPQNNSASPNMTDTIPRSIADKQFGARKLEGCISCFFQYYAHNVPGIFDTLQNPNDLFNHSEFLFWTIVYVGSRKYIKDPTIVEFLAKPLSDLAKQYLFEPDHAIPNIQATILICLWPLPANTNFTLRSHAMAGAALQLALQKGLPFASRKQDFSPVPLTQSEKDEAFRAKLWAHCVMVFQASDIYDGLLCTTVVDTDHVNRNLSAFNGLPALVAYRYRLHRFHIDAIASILSYADPVSQKNDDLLNSLIKQLDAEAQRIIATPEDDLSRHALASVRLFIRAFHFFSAPNPNRDLGILQTYYIACEIIQIATRLDHSTDFALYCTIMQSRALALSVVIVLRVLRSSLGAQVDAEEGENMIFEAVRLIKRRSIRNDDLDARSARILTQLWSSDRLFLYKDGRRDGLRLLLHARLSMSVYFDLHWWWRAEFGGKSNPYLELVGAADREEQPLNEADTSAANAMTVQFPLENQDKMNLMAPDLLQSTTFFGDLPDCNWDEFQDGLLL